MTVMNGQETHLKLTRSDTFREKDWFAFPTRQVVRYTEISPARDFHIRQFGTYIDSTRLLTPAFVITS